MIETNNFGVADISDAIPSDEGVLHIVVPGTNKRTGWQITFAGPGHAKTVAQNNELSRAALQKAERIEMAQVNARKWKGDGKQPQDVRRENVDWVVGRILTWTPVRIKQFSVDQVEFSDKVAKELLMQPYMAPYFVQMTDYLADQASFIAGSASN